MSPLALAAAAAALTALLQTPAQPPEPQTSDSTRRAVTASAGVTPDTVTVGDHFQVLLRVRVPTGATVQFPAFNLIEPVEAMDSVRVEGDSLGVWTATYELAAWTTSDSLVATFPFRVRSPEGQVSDLRVRIALPHVRSVLPADSTLHVPRPAKAVIPIAVMGPTPQGWLLPAALLLAVVGVIVWLAMRRRGAATTPADPRAAALDELDRIEKEGLLEGGDVHAYHVRVSRVLRQYLAAQGGWGEDLTTTEMLDSVRRDRLDVRLERDLERLLRQADRVKFAGTAAGGEDAATTAFGPGVRDWILAWPQSAATPPRRAEAA